METLTLVEHIEAARVAAQEECCKVHADWIKRVRETPRQARRGVELRAGYGASGLEVQAYRKDARRTASAAASALLQRLRDRPSNNGRISITRPGLSIYQPTPPAVQAAAARPSANLGVPLAKIMHRPLRLSEIGFGNMMGAQTGAA